jgi:hypothetical protein
VAHFVPNRCHTPARADPASRSPSCLMEFTTLEINVEYHPETLEVLSLYPQAQQATPSRDGLNSLPESQACAQE